VDLKKKTAEIMLNACCASTPAKARRLNFLKQVKRLNSQKDRERAEGSHVKQVFHFKGPLLWG